MDVCDVSRDGSVSSCVQDELTTYIGRVLEEAKERWDKGEMPKKEDGCFVGTVAYDVIQVRNQRDDGVTGVACSDEAGAALGLCRAL